MCDSKVYVFDFFLGNEETGEVRNGRGNDDEKQARLLRKRSAKYILKICDIKKMETGNIHGETDEEI